MRIICNTVVRNEANRYWASWLEWTVPIFGAENIHVYDDNSDDETLRMALDAKVVVSTRGSAEPSFIDHEGGFRQRAWDVMNQALKPEPEDWVFSIDADEILVGQSDEASQLWTACSDANERGVGAYLVKIPEVFSADEKDGYLTNPKVRTDGFWGTIQGTRLFRWQPSGKFADRKMGCGSEPDFVQKAVRSPLENLWLMHYGYARPEDQQTKYARYNSMEHGHSDQHIQSILKEPTLVSWVGPSIDIRFGKGT